MIVSVFRNEYQRKSGIVAIKHYSEQKISFCYLKQYKVTFYDILA